MNNAVIIEDQLSGINLLKRLLAKHCPEVKVVGVARSVKEGLELIRNLPVKLDIAFLDIHLPDGFVFELLDELKTPTFSPVFVTGHDHLMMKAFDYSNLGFVLKPINPDDLIEAVKCAILGKENQIFKEQVEIFKSHFQHPNPFSKITLPGKYGLYFTKIKEIDYLVASDNYTNFHLSNGTKHLVTLNIGKYEQLFSPFSFFRIHKKYIVNLNRILYFSKEEGDVHVVMEDGAKLEVSRRRRKGFVERLKQLQKNFKPIL